MNEFEELATEKSKEKHKREKKLKKEKKTKREREEDDGTDGEDERRKKFDTIVSSTHNHWKVRLHSHQTSGL